jgi:hypothetical protein
MSHRVTGLWPIEARVNKGALGVKNTPEFRTKRSIVNAKINKQG